MISDTRKANPHEFELAQETVSMMAQGSQDPVRLFLKDCYVDFLRWTKKKYGYLTIDALAAIILWYEYITDMRMYATAIKTVDIKFPQGQIKKRTSGRKK